MYYKIKYTTTYTYFKKDVMPAIIKFIILKDFNNENKIKEEIDAFVKIIDNYSFILRIIFGNGLIIIGLFGFFNIIRFSNIGKYIFLFMLVACFLFLGIPTIMAFVKFRFGKGRGIVKQRGRPVRRDKPA
jgi:hypothetical protein